MRTMRDVFTKSDYERLPEGFPAQLIEGCLVKEPTPTYGHQSVVTRLVLALARHVHPDLIVLSPTDVLVDEVNVFQPDLVVLRRRPPLDDHYVGTPLVAFEVLSPASVRHDREVKLPRLLDLGVEEVWLVDPRARTIERHDRTGATQGDPDAAVASQAVPGLELTPAILFA